MAAQQLSTFSACRHDQDGLLRLKLPTSLAAVAQACGDVMVPGIFWFLEHYNELTRATWYRGVP